MLAVRARALLDGRMAPSTGDVVALAGPGTAPSHGAGFLRPRRGATTASVIERLCHDLL